MGDGSEASRSAPPALSRCGPSGSGRRSRMVGRQLRGTLRSSSEPAWGRDPRRQNPRRRTGRGCLGGVSVRGSSQRRARGHGTSVRLRFRMYPAFPRGGLRRREPRAGQVHRRDVMGEPCLKEGAGLRDASVQGRTWYIGIIRQSYFVTLHFLMCKTRGINNMCLVGLFRR